MVNDLGYQWGHIFILLCPFVQWSIVLYWMEFAIFLFNEEEIGCIGRFGNANCPLVQVLLYEFMDLSLFLKIQWQ